MAFKKHFLLLLFLLFAVAAQAQTVYKTRTGAKYHVQTCHYLKSSIQTTVAEAQAAGLGPCSVCRPPAGTASGNSPAVQATGTTAAGTNTTSSSTSLSSQCSGTTKAGNRCKRLTTSADGRCYQH